MERNSNYTKEKADFIFNRILRYFEQQAYALALSEIEANRELLGSSLNIGSQLKLNKIYSKTVVNLLLDAFEVEGDLSTFTSLFARHKTMLELHTDRDTYHLLHTFLAQKESNPGYRSRETKYNRDIEPDDSVFPDEEAVQISIKSSSHKIPSAKDIERDFLDSIESPSFQFGQLTEIEEAMPVDTVIKSSVNRKAIHDDFFEAIRPPKLTDFRSSTESYEQLSFEEAIEDKHSDGRDVKKASDISRNVKRLNTDGFISDKSEPVRAVSISEQGEDDSVRAIREKLQQIEERTSGKKNEAKKNNKPKKNVAVKEQREIVEDGQTRRETIHRSGGKITEITIDGYSSENGERKKASNKGKQSSKRTKSSADRSKDASPKTSDRTLHSKPEAKNPISSDKKISEARISYLAIALALICAVLLAFGLFRAIRHFTARDTEPSVVEPATPNTDENTGNEDAGSEGDASDPSGSTDSTSSESTPAEPAAEDSYLLPSDERELVRADYENLTKAQIRISINELFARHGWNFGSSGEMYDYFSQKSWYKPDLSMTSSAQAEAKFSEIERKNLSILRTYFQTLP